VAGFRTYLETEGDCGCAKGATVFARVLNSGFRMNHGMRLAVFLSVVILGRVVVSETIDDSATTLPAQSTFAPQSELDDSPDAGLA
jgi:hypothetical protein